MLGNTFSVLSSSFFIPDVLGMFYCFLLIHFRRVLTVDDCSVVLTVDMGLLVVYRYL